MPTSSPRAAAVGRPTNANQSRVSVIETPVVAPETRLLVGHVLGRVECVPVHVGVAVQMGLLAEEIFSGFPRADADHGTGRGPGRGP
ncbi:hypothetical protein ACU686_14330 [Yinghuangia aomiensis]